MTSEGSAVHPQQEEARFIEKMHDRLHAHSNWKVLRTLCVGMTRSNRSKANPPETINLSKD